MILRILITLIVFVVFTSPHSYGQRKQDKQSIISQIRQVFQQINGYKNYKVLTVDESEGFLEHGTDNGGSLKGFYKGDSLKKIVAWVGLSNRVVQNEYYFNNGKLVFVYSIDSRCKSKENTGEIDCSKFDKVFKGRYYFSNDTLIDTILNDKEREKTKQQDAADFLTSGKNYLKLLNGKRQ
jgi:hypothetical protein